MKRLFFSCTADFPPFKDFYFENTASCHRSIYFEGYGWLCGLHSWPSRLIENMWSEAEKPSNENVSAAAQTPADPLKNINTSDRFLSVSVPMRVISQTSCPASDSFSHRIQWHAHCSHGIVGKISWQVKRVVLMSLVCGGDEFLSVSFMSDQQQKDSLCCVFACN